MRNWLMVLPPVMFVALAGLFYVGMQREDPDSLPSALLGKPVPAIDHLSPLGSKTPITAEALADGEVKLVNFWASWCAPCRVEHPNLQALAESGLPIYGINYRDDADNALGFLSELGDPYEAVSADISARTALEWGVYGVPETYIIGSKGEVLARIAGPVTRRTFDAQMRDVLVAAGVELPF